jgi:hypothetical protein
LALIVFRRFHWLKTGSCWRRPATVGLLNVSGTIEPDGDFAVLHDNGHLAAAI